MNLWIINFLKKRTYHNQFGSLQESSVDDLEGKQVFIRIDVIWAFLSLMKTSNGCSLRFLNLSRVARLIWVLPHSNAGVE